MKFYSESDLKTVLDFPKLISALRTGFTEKFVIPPRMHLDYPNPEDDTENTMLLMPAVRVGETAGVKIVNVTPANSTRSLSSIQGIYYLFHAVSGIPLAIFDAKSLTNWRTAAASALAASYLAKDSAGSLLMVGTGALAPFLIEAHAAIRPIRQVIIYGRNRVKAEKLATSFQSRFDQVMVATELSESVPKADVISVATFSPTALINGNWLRPGQHVDLVGSFKPDMREADDRVIQRSSVFVDNLEMAPIESGDLAIPIERGVLQIDDIKGDLFKLCKGSVKGRSNQNEITVFKSVGHALEDLVAARLVTQLKAL